MFPAGRNWSKLEANRIAPLRTARCRIDLRPRIPSCSVRGLFALTLVAAAVAFAGCADNQSYPNDPKPPAVLNVTVIVSEDQIAASPVKFGAGPTRFVMTNQTGTDQLVTLSTDQSDRKIKVGQSQTVNFKQTLQPGIATIDASNSAANTLTLHVGPERPTAQQDLNQP